MIPRPISLALALVAFLASASRAAGAAHVTAELLADVASVRAGQPFEVALRLRIEPGWHVYWENPGDSGLATRVQFDLPPGFTAGPVKFPIPEKITLPGDIVNYGYEREATLTATITPPAQLPAGPLPIAARATWLVCSADVCVPGKQTATVVLRRGDGAAANTDAFSQWRAAMPVEASAAGDAVHVERKTGNDAVTTTTVRFTFDRVVRSVDWFPLPGASLMVTNVQISPAEGTDVTVTFDAKPTEFFDHKPWLAGGLLVFTDGRGTRGGILVPIDSPATSAPPAR